MTNYTNTPSRIYVGTYGKYNSGSIAGQWLDLADYADAEAFTKACQELHGPGEHEFMYQDWEGIPEGMVTESNLSADYWEWADMSDNEKELLSVYREHVDQSGTLEQAQDADAGRYASPEDWAEEFLEDIGGLDEMPQNLRCYFDYAAYARDAGFNGMVFAAHGGGVWVFHSN